MAVVSISEKFEDRTGGFYPENAEEVVRSWLIITDNKFDNSLTIKAGAGGTLPGFLTPHPQNIFYTCRRLTINPRSGGGAKAWDATATYSTAPLENKDQAENENPLNRRTRLQFKSSKAEIYTLEDVNGNALLNSAYDAYPPQPQTIGDVALILSRNVAVRPLWVFDGIESTNDADWTVQGVTVPKNKGKLESFELSEEKEENGVTYFEASAEVLYRKRGWTLKLPDEGFQFVIGVDKYVIKLKNPDTGLYSDRPTESQLLNGAGDILQPGAEPVIFEFTMLEEYNFANLPFA